MLKVSHVNAKIIAVISIFAALNVILDSIPGLPEPYSGVWYSWNFVLAPLTGIILGPLLGFFSSLIGVMIGHVIYFIDVYEFIFTLGTPIGVAISALIFTGKWKLVLAYYCILFSAYFATPLAWKLPVWGMWDTYLAFVILLSTIILINKHKWSVNSKRKSLVLAVAAFIGLEADVLFRIFILVPGQTYKFFYGWNAEQLIAIWGVGAVYTPLKILLSILITVIVGLPLLEVLKKMLHLFDARNI